MSIGGSVRLWRLVKEIKCDCQFDSWKFRVILFYNERSFTWRCKSTLMMQHVHGASSRNINPCVQWSLNSIFISRKFRAADASNEWEVYHLASGKNMCIGKKVDWPRLVQIIRSITIIRLDSLLRLLNFFKMHTCMAFRSCFMVKCCI